MLESLITMFGILFPPMIYAFIIWMTMPYSTIKFSAGIKYFTFGAISIPILSFMWATFPSFFGDWQLGIFGPTPEDLYWTEAFVKVAWPEELSKYLAFFIITQTRWENKESDFPIGLMYYSAMVGLSFGLVENISYTSMYGMEVLPTRSITALVMHMITGLLMGYFIALGNHTYKSKGRSVLSILTYKNKVFSTILYGFFGVMVATGLHGLYDYNLFIDRYYYELAIHTGSAPYTNAQTILFFILGMGATAAYTGARHLNNLSQKK